MIPLAVATMVYDDEVFLKIWLSYWTRFLPKKNLYVLIHGDYENYERIAEGCNTIRIGRPRVHSRSEIDRWDMLSSFSSGFTPMFEKVIYTDVDEIIALDPDKGDDLVSHILSIPNPISAPFGLEVVEPPELGLSPYTENKSVLSQRPYVSSATPYSKPCIISKPVRWSQGGHYCDHQDTHLADGLYNFHLRLFDLTVYNHRADKRIKMVTNEDTGQPIEGLGGPSWRRRDEHRKYEIETPTPMPNIEFRKDKQMWLNDATLDEDGFWRRKGRLRKTLHHLPERFLNVF